MFIVNSTDKTTSEVKEISFREIGLRERSDLQEWIANNPIILGEELLIIQKEFDGFNDTNERLDLLALDKNGNLVKDENWYSYYEGIKMQQRLAQKYNLDYLPINQDKYLNFNCNIDELNLNGLFGENGVEGAHLVKRKGETDEELVDIAIDGFFLAIGHKPNSDVFKQWLDTDEVGYIKKIDGTPRTKVPGVFVAGDVADPVYRQAITAAASGCQAAIEAERYLMNK